MVIYNPVAGNARQARPSIKQLRTRLGAAVRTTRKRGEAVRLARDAVKKGFDYLIAAGGDGTLNEVINGIGADFDRVQVGLLPLGTGNDFARTLNLPTSLQDNVEILIARRTTRIDLVRVTSDRTRYLVNVSAGGFSGLVDKKLTRKIKRTWGPLAYVRSAAAAFPKLHAYRTKIAVDEKPPFSMDLYNVIVANGRFVAGGLPVAPRADLQDGLIDVILIPKTSTPEIILLAAQMVLGNHLSTKSVVFHRATKISIRSRPGMWFNADGELVGHDPVVFQALPHALAFIVGHK